jgi:hypothetical protein
MGGTMTRKELDEHLNIIKAHRSNVDNYIHAIKQLSDGIAIDYSYDLECAYISLVSKLAGDTGDWISWYVDENDFGRKKYEAGYDGKMKQIKSTRDLLNLIEEGKKR